LQLTYVYCRDKEISAYTVEKLGCGKNTPLTYFAVIAWNFKHKIYTHLVIIYIQKHMVLK